MSPSLHRRALLASGLALASAGVAQAAPAAPIRRIATEEGYSIPELIDSVNAYMRAHPDREPGFQAMLAGGPLPAGLKITDPETRLRDMDASGVATQVLLLNSPGVQVFDDPVQASELAALANDRVAAWQRRWPDRFAPLAAFAPQSPAKAAQELERGVKRLGLHGGLINSNTHGEYLDQKKFWPIFEAAQALRAPIYIHPRELPAAAVGPYVDYGLQGAIWGYAAEVSLHSLRLIMAGVFDQVPDLTIVIGHLGEGLPFYLERLDNRFDVMHAGSRFHLKMKPSDYLRRNFIITTSGANWSPAVRFCQQVLGPERVMFAVDYPFEDGPSTVAEADAIPMLPADRALFYHANAERVFRIAPQRRA